MRIAGTHSPCMIAFSQSTDGQCRSTSDAYGRRVAASDNRLPAADYPTQTFVWEYNNHDWKTKEIYPDG